MKYSVIIPLYNKQKYITQTIRSVLNQTYKDYEVIVIDDGSTDDSFSKLKEMQDERLTIVRQNNQGVSVARNTGIERAQGEFVAFLDADDAWDDNYLETIDELTAQFSQCDIFVTAYRVLFDHGKTRMPQKMCSHNCCISSYWKTYQSAYDIVWTSATVLRKKAIVTAGMFTVGEKTGEDLDLWARVACMNPCVAYSPRPCVTYLRCTEQNARTSVRIAYPKAFLEVLQREMSNKRWTDEDKTWMRKKYNRKMMVYVFTSILANRRQEARGILYDWGRTCFCSAIPFLYCASFLPNCLNRYVYSIRLKVF